MARDIARAFNRTYGTEILIEPEEFILPEVATIPGLDGRKMSKSYNNFIGVFEEEKTLKKKIATIVTDSRGVEESKDPDTCNVFGLIQYFGSPERVSSVRAKYLAGGYGYGHAKAELLEILIDYLAPYQWIRRELLGDISFIEARLAQGAQVMNARMEITLEQVRQMTGV